MQKSFRRETDQLVGWQASSGGAKIDKLVYTKYNISMEFPHIWMFPKIQHIYSWFMFPKMGVITPLINPVLIHIFFLMGFSMKFLPSIFQLPPWPMSSRWIGVSAPCLKSICCPGAVSSIWSAAKPWGAAAPSTTTCAWAVLI